MKELVLNRLHQVTLEDAYSRKHIRNKVKADIQEGINTELKAVFKKCVAAIDEYICKDYYASKRKRIDSIAHLSSEDIAVELFIAVIPNKGRVPIQNVAFSLGAWFELDDVFEGVRTAAEIIGATAETGLHDVWTNPIMIQPLLGLEEETILFIEKTRYLNPMIYEPDKWSNNRKGGYLSIEDSILLGKGNNHMEYQALDVINTLQSIEWELDEVMVNYEEKAKKPFKTQQAREAHELHTKVAVDVYQEIMDQGNKFWFVWKYDFRGRVYSQGYYVNLQSTGYKKALLNFANKQWIEL